MSFKFEDFIERVFARLEKKYPYYVRCVHRWSGKEDEWCHDVVQDGVIKLIENIQANQGIKKNGEPIDVERDLDPLVLKNCRWVMLSRLAKLANLPMQNLEDRADQTVDPGDGPERMSELRELYKLVEEAFDDVSGPERIVSEAIRHLLSKSSQEDAGENRSKWPNYEQIGEWIHKQTGERIPASTLRVYWMRALEQIRRFLEDKLGP